ncbi:MAG TPA: MgtC/SapB family protein [Usitatibacter sp.]
MQGLDDAAWIAARLAAALFVGAVVGINRDLHRKAAGLRTLALVAVGSAVLVIVTIIMTDGNGDSLSRVIQGIVAGVGFLGAGVIMHHETGGRVEGLTTAASVWVAAGLGAACGAGLMVVAVLALLTTMAILTFGGPIERALERRFWKPGTEMRPEDQEH